MLSEGGIGGRGDESDRSDNSDGSEEGKWLCREHGAYH